MARTLRDDGLAPIRLRTLGSDAAWTLKRGELNPADAHRLAVAFEERKTAIRLLARLYRG
jgi:hypothetical protein